MEAPSYSRQCPVRAFMEGTKFFDEGNPFNGKMCEEKLKPTKTYCPTFDLKNKGKTRTSFCVS